MNNTSRDPNCTCTRADGVCRCDQITDPAALVDLVALLTMERQPTGNVTERLRYALDRLIDERVEKRLAEKKRSLAEIMAAARAAEAAAKKTRGQEIAEQLVGALAVDPMKGVALYPDSSAYVPLVLSPREYGNEMTVNAARKMVARAIDKAIADEREACVEVVEMATPDVIKGTWFNEYREYKRKAADAIRNRK